MQNQKSSASGSYKLYRLAALLCTTAIPMTGAFAQEAPSATEEAAQPTEGQEILVTAGRRSQILQDIPYNITAISGEGLEKSGVTSINNLSQAIPGLQNVDTGPNARGGNSNFSMRGLRTDAAGSGGGTPVFRTGSVASVSTYLGETPIFFALQVKDLDRVEVLKGPQGTLYGSGAQAGTIRLIPKRPSFDGISGEINAQGGISEFSSKANYSTDGVLNLPLGENLAVRFGAGYERLGGFIDAAGLVKRDAPGGIFGAPVLRVPSDPLSGLVQAPIQRDTNSSEQWFARGALRWKPSDSVDIELSYLHQYTGVSDSQISNPNYAGGTFNYGSPIEAYPGDPAPVVFANPNSTNTYRAGGKYASTNDLLSPSKSSLDLANLTMSFDLGFATFTSSSSGFKTKADEETFYSSANLLLNPDGSIYNYVAVAYTAFPRATASNKLHSEEETFTQEVRLVSNGDGPLSYVLGAYYQSQNYNFTNLSIIPGYSAYLASIGFPQNNPQTGDVFFSYDPLKNNGFKFRDKALFGELSYKLTPEWQVTIGTRFFWQSYRNLGSAFAYACGAICSIDGIDPLGKAIDADRTSKVNDHILKINTSYDVNPDLKIYATYSEGFRRGGSNSVASSGAPASLPFFQTFAPDVAKNYELGIKGSILNGRLRYAADIFLIDLENFQFAGLTGSGYPAVINGTNARSKGIEVDTEFRATRNLTLRAAYNYTDAKVRKGFDILDYPFFGLLTTPPGTAPTLIVANSVAAGARLPGVPKHTFSLGADYNMAVGDRSSVNLHLDAAYKSSAPGTIDSTSGFFWTIPSSLFANSRITYDSGNSWSIDAFVNNITNETGYSGSIGIQKIPTHVSGRYVARPRTYGLGLHYKF
jgi:iron complex outermembrane recepter protein